jgi:hypothetical protein
MNAIGLITITAVSKRMDAITRDGAPDCANLIKIDAVETAKIPKNKPIIG